MIIVIVIINREGLIGKVLIDILQLLIYSFGFFKYGCPSINIDWSAAISLF